VLFAVHNILGYFVALVAGVLVGCAAVVALKSTAKTRDEDIAPVA
jgi:PTS system fructose-specific IIC component